MDTPKPESLNIYYILDSQNACIPSVCVSCCKQEVPLPAGSPWWVPSWEAPRLGPTKKIKIYIYKYEAVYHRTTSYQSERNCTGLCLWRLWCWFNGLLLWQDGRGLSGGYRPQTRVFKHIYIYIFYLLDSQNACIPSVCVSCCKQGFPWPVGSPWWVPSW